MNNRKITAGDIRRALNGVPDDVSVLFNVEENDNENWDTFDVSIHNNSYLCKGEKGCTHTEPEMFWDIVVFVRHPKLGDRSITTDKV
jgi:hypothetical protein